MSCEACKFPFEVAEIDWDGNVYGCCAGYFVGYSFGNIFKQPFDEIWNGEKAKEFRRQFITQEFKYCDFTRCAKEWHPYNPTEEAPYPIRVQLNYDAICNARCIYCRQGACESNKKPFDEHMEDIVLPILKNAKLVNVTALGELFASSYSKNLIEKITETYPNIKFYVYTNGIECSKEKIEEYHLTNKIDYIVLSMPALTKETYNKIVMGGNFDKVIANIKYLSELQQSENKMNAFVLNFVVNALNFHEMIDYVDFAKQNNATVSFVKLNNTSGNDYIYKELAVAEEWHPLHKEYLEVVHNPVFRQSHVNKTSTFTTLNLQ